MPRPPEEVLSDPNRYFMEWIPQSLAARSDLAERLGGASAVVQMKLDGEAGGAWHFVIADGTVSVVAGEHAAPSFTVSMSVETWRAMQKREIQPQAAFFQGLVKIQGDYGAAMRLMPLFR